MSAGASSRCCGRIVEHEEATRNALLQEGELLRDLTHPHLVRAYEVIMEPRTAVVLETLSGATLGALIERGPLAPPTRPGWGQQLASVLNYLHRNGWLHLDVKPSNIIVQAGRAILIDLSLATRPGDGRPHAGTDGYLAPEQVSGVGLTPAADVFGLGVTLGEALTRELPYGEEIRWRTDTAPQRATRPFRRRLGQVPARLADLIEACIDPDPTRRPSLAEARLVLAAEVETQPSGRSVP